MGSLYKIYAEVSCKSVTALCILTVFAYFSVTEGSDDSLWFQDLCR